MALHRRENPPQPAPEKAAFEEPKAMEEFEFAVFPSIKTTATKDLATGLFVEKKKHMMAPQKIQRIVRACL